MLKHEFLPSQAASVDEANNVTLATSLSSYGPPSQSVSFQMASSCAELELGSSNSRHRFSSQREDWPRQYKPKNSTPEVSSRADYVLQLCQRQDDTGLIRVLINNCCYAFIRSMLETRQGCPGLACQYSAPCLSSWYCTGVTTPCD